MTVQIRTYEPTQAKIKALVYGPSGIGKTTFGATAPKPLFVSAEGGLLSVADKTPHFAEIKSLQDLRDVYAYLQKEKHDYDTVVIDSLTEIQSFIINKITGGTRMPQKSEWSDFAFEMNKILRAYRDLPMHVIFLALETEKEEGEDGASRFMPDLYGKVRTAGAAYMDFVGRMGITHITVDNMKEEKRGICFIANSRFVAKDRTAKLPPFVDPDFTAILEQIGTIKTGEGSLVAEAGQTPSTTTPAADATNTSASPEQNAPTNIDHTKKADEADPTASAESIRKIASLTKDLNITVQNAYGLAGIGSVPTQEQADNLIGRLEEQLVEQTEKANPAESK